MTDINQPATLAHPPQHPSPDAVREQLERMLTSPRFSTSPRCQLLLRHVVEQTLKGNAEALKERNIGIEVFHRDPAYDTNADPSVRVAASEIRKKLAQYYYEPGTQEQVRIELPTGSYVPIFSVLDQPAAAAETGGPLPELVPAEPFVPVDLSQRSAGLARQTQSRLRLLRWALPALVVLLLAASFAGWRWMEARNPATLFWAPFVQAHKTILLCTGEIGSQHGIFPNPAGNSASSVMALGPNGVYSRELVTVVFDDVVLLADLAAKLHAENLPYTVRYEANTNYEDLLKGPVLLIGSFNNAWTLHFTQSLRYSFAHDADNFLWIADKENPGVKLGMQRINQEIYGTEEYAVVARLIDSEAKQPALIIAGVSPTATRAAGQLVTNPWLLRETLRKLPANWPAKNMELLLKVHVIDNQAGPPQLVSQVIW